MQVRPSDSRGDIAEGILATTDFVECYQTHYRRLIRALRLSGADRSTAEDVAQEAFARSLVHWRRVRKGTNPVGYVYTAAFRLWQRSQLPLVEATAIVPPPSTPAAEGAVTTSLAIEGALAAMPPKRRACAVLCLVVGVSTRDASNALGIAEGTVRKHIEDARRDIRAACASD